MERQEKRYAAKIKYGVIAVVIIVALFLAYSYIYLPFSIDKHVPECEKLVPLDSPPKLPNDRSAEVDTDRELDFNEKGRIAYGKYGFRRKIELKEKTIIAQGVVEDLQLKDLFYGIYTDPKLNDPVLEVSMVKMLKASHDIEMGAPIEDYPDYAPYHEIVLEPGTYYLAVYSTNPREKNIAMYECRQGVVVTDLALKEREWGFFFSTGKEQKTYFKIYVAEPGTISVERDFWKVTYDIWLCDANKEPLISAVLTSEKPKKEHQKAQITVPKAGIYYLQISTENPKPSCWAYEVRYQMTQ